MARALGDDRRHQMALLLDLLDRHDDERVRRAVAEAQALEGDRITASARALVAILRSSGVVDLDAMASPTWMAIPVAQRVALVLVEVEQIPVARAAQLLWVPPAELAEAHRRGCEAMGWAPLERVACAGWPTVARMHRVGTEDGTAAIIHLEHCLRCAVWHLDRQQRRTALAEHAPHIGASGLGYLWDPASI